MRRNHLKPASKVLLMCVAVAMILVRPVKSQTVPYERSFPQSKAAVEKAIAKLQSSASGRLPVLDGFTSPGDRALDHFQRGYYQCSIQVTSTPSGGSLVRVSAKITAWYADPVASKSGYQVLPSNGRLETDLLDRLQDALGPSSLPASSAPIDSTSPRGKSNPAVPSAAISAPAPGNSAPAASNFPSAPAPAKSPFKLGNSFNSDEATSLATQKAVADKHMEELTKEAKGLEEILQNQAHPQNLVAVKKSGTPVLVSPVEGAKVLFLATAEDEFEILDLNANWVHVRISGLSRGWIRRSSLEVPDSFTSGSEASDAKVENPQTPPSAEPFQVKSEEIASFPGTWEPLQGQTVKIVTVQSTNRTASSSSSQRKLEFAKSIFQKEYAQLTQMPSGAAGVVLIFDSADGGIVAATLPLLQQWKAGTLSDKAFWRRCFFDPPETFAPPPG